MDLFCVAVRWVDCLKALPGLALRKFERKTVDLAKRSCRLALVAGQTGKSNRDFHRLVAPE